MWASMNSKLLLRGTLAELLVIWDVFSLLFLRFVLFLQVFQNNVKVKSYMIYNDNTCYKIKIVAIVVG